MWWIMQHTLTLWSCPHHSHSTSLFGFYLHGIIASSLRQMLWNYFPYLLFPFSQGLSVPNLLLIYFSTIPPFEIPLTTHPQLPIRATYFPFYWVLGSSWKINLTLSGSILKKGTISYCFSAKLYTGACSSPCFKSVFCHHRFSCISYTFHSTAITFPKSPVNFSHLFAHPLPVITPLIHKILFIQHDFPMWTQNSLDQSSPRITRKLVPNILSSNPGVFKPLI